MKNNSEPIKGVIYYKLDSEYNGDITRNCGLKASEIDGNFYFLRGNDIDHIEWDEEDSSLLNLVRVNGDKVEVNLSGITSNISLEGSYFDKEKGILHIFVNGEDNEIDGFEIRTVYAEIPETSKTGFFAPVKSFIDITKEEKLPESPNLGDRYLTKESINKYGFLYNFKGVQEVVEKLKKENSKWHVPSNDEWGEMLNAIELCDEDRTHISVKSNVDLGLNAGAFLKKDGEGWKVSNTTVQPNEIEKSFGFKVNPVGGIGIAAPQNVNSNIQYQGESTEFWTSSILENSDIWARRFDYNKDTVRQQAEGSDTFCSIRLIANSFNQKNTRMETINGLPYKLVSMPSVKVNDKNEIFDGDNYLWTVENISIPVSEGNYYPTNLSDDANEVYYFINYWNGSEWEKEIFPNYSIVYIEKEEKDKRLIDNELKDFVTTGSGSTGGDYDEEIKKINNEISSINETVTDLSLKNSDNSEKINALEESLTNKANKDHNHDDVYAKKEIESRVAENVSAIAEIKSSLGDVDGKISKAVEGYNVKNISENDKILSLKDGELSSELSLVYNSEDNFIRLLGKDHIKISGFDASVFLKDGMLENAEMADTNDGGEKGTFIKLTFNTDAGSKVIYLDVASLVDVYTAGRGLVLNNNEFSINEKIVATKSDLESKVDVVDGKGLSSNDYTTEEKDKLAGIEKGAEKNAIKIIKVNGTALTVNEEDKSVNIEITSSGDPNIYKADDETLTGTTEGNTTTFKVNKIKVENISDFESEVNEKLNNLTIDSSKVNGLDNKLSEIEKKIPSLDGYATTDNVNQVKKDAIAASKEYTDTKIGEITIPEVTVSDVKLNGNSVVKGKIADIQNLDSNTKISKNIKIEGGPLADDETKNIFPNGITTDMTLQEVLEKLFTKEIYPSIKTNEGSYAISISTTPQITADVAKNSLVEAGQAITINTINSNAIKEAIVKPSLGGFTYGYSDTINGDINKVDNISIDWEREKKIDSKYVLSLSKVSGFTNFTTVSAEGEDVAQIPNQEVVADLGVNTLKIEENAPIMICKHNGIESKYIVSNLGNRKEDKKSDGIPTKSEAEASAETRSSEFTITGVYPIYTNGITSATGETSAPTVTDNANDDTKLPLVENSVTFGVAFPAMADGGRGYRLLLHESKMISEAFALNGSTAKYDIDFSKEFIKGESVTCKSAGKNQTYYIWEAKGTDGANRINLKIKSI